VRRLDFVFQMVWQEQPLADRVAKKDAERAAAAEEQKRLEDEEKRAAESGNAP
jgi:hypothetical protein